MVKPAQEAQLDWAIITQVLDRAGVTGKFDRALNSMLTEQQQQQPKATKPKPNPKAPKKPTQSRRTVRRMQL